jgi:predicted nucleotidyltransferase
MFGSLARGEARPDSDIDVAVSFGKPMSSDLRMAVTGIVADAAGRSVDLVDLETADGLILARALGGREILCDGVATRQRMIARLRRSEDDRRSAALAARAARAGLFT